MSVVKEAKRTVRNVLSAGALRHSRRGPAGTFGLTFDDGPDPEVTPRLLDLLAKYDATATFYLIGEKIAAARSVVSRIVEEGHSLGNHSFYHRRFAKLPLNEQLDEIMKTNALLAEFAPKDSFAFRPPRGVVPMRFLLHAAIDRLPIQMWTIDSDDCRKSAADVVAGLSERSLSSSDVVLFHDDGDCALNALTELLPIWQQRGLTGRAV